MSTQETLNVDYKKKSEVLNEGKFNVDSKNVQCRLEKKSAVSNEDKFNVDSKNVQC